MARTPDIAVIGAGIVGAYAAYYLAKSGLKPMIVERAGIANQASRWNPGGLNPLHGVGIPGPMEEFSQLSFKLHLDNADALAAHAESSYQLRPTSRIQLAITKEEEAQLRASKLRYNACPGFSAKLVSGEDLLKLDSRISPKVRSGLVQEGNYSVDTQAYANSLVNAACTMGATLVEDEVRGIEHSNGHINTLVLAKGAQAVGAVVFATGPWVSGPAQWLEAPIPVWPVKGQLLWAGSSPTGSGRYDITHGLTGIYHGTDGAVLIGGTEEDTDFDLAADEAGRRSILNGLSEILVLEDHFQIGKQLAAARPVSNDQLPIIGRVPKWKNAYLLTGAGRKGVLYSSGMGLAIAHEITTGKTHPLAEPCAYR